MKEKDFYTLEEIEDEFIGVKGTPKRDKYEADLNAFLIGEAIKQAREARNLTQEQLGELMGVKRAQISKIESGKSISFSTIVRAFKAMGVNTDGMTESEGIGAAVDAVRKLSLSIGIPQKLHEINVKEEDLHQLAVDAFNDVCTGGNPRPTSVEEIEALYRKAF